VAVILNVAEKRLSHFVGGSNNNINKGIEKPSNRKRFGGFPAIGNYM